MASFLALYQGESVGAAKLVAVTSDPKIVREFAARLLDHQPESDDPDPVLRAIDGGRRQALRIVAEGD